MEIKTPDDIAEFLKGINLTDAKRKAMHRDIANLTRKYFRDQVRAQRGVDGKPYAPRKRAKKDWRVVKNYEKTWRTTKAGKSVRSRTYYYEVERFTVERSKDARLNMLTGISRSLMAKHDKDGFEVGVTGTVGKVATLHNDGATISFSYRMKSWFNSKTGKFEGGRKMKSAYELPKRPHIGWNTELKAMVMQKAYEFTKGE